MERIAATSASTTALPWDTWARQVFAAQERALAARRHGAKG